jgi:hypothetical protein
MIGREGRGRREGEPGGGKRERERDMKTFLFTLKTKIF